MLEQADSTNSPDYIERFISPFTFVSGPEFLQAYANIRKQQSSSVLESDTVKDFLKLFGIFCKGLLEIVVQISVGLIFAVVKS